LKYRFTKIAFVSVFLSVTSLSNARLVKQERCSTFNGLKASDPSCCDVTVDSHDIHRPSSFWNSILQSLV